MSAPSKEARIRYNKSEKGKAARARHAKTDTFKATQRRYKATEKGRAKINEVANNRYWRDPDYHRMKALGRIHGIEVDLLKAVRERDRVCQHCSSSDNLTFDHIIPVSKGGKASMDNLQILCNPCNAAKGNR